VGSREENTHNRVLLFAHLTLKHPQDKNDIGVDNICPLNIHT